MHKETSCPLIGQCRQGVFKHLTSGEGGRGWVYCKLSGKRRKSRQENELVHKCKRKNLSILYTCVCTHTIILAIFNWNCVVAVLIAFTFTFLKKSALTAGWAPLPIIKKGGKKFRPCKKQSLKKYMWNKRKKFDKRKVLKPSGAAHPVC